LGCLDSALPETRFYAEPESAGFGPIVPRDGGAGGRPGGSLLRSANEELNAGFWRTGRSNVTEVD